MTVAAPPNTSDDGYMKRTHWSNGYLMDGADRAVLHFVGLCAYDSDLDGDFNAGSDDENDLTDTSYVVVVQDPIREPHSAHFHAGITNLNHVMADKGNAYEPLSDAIVLKWYLYSKRGPSVRIVCPVARIY